jgi:lipopolysaccharide transport system ATP-binding protein
VVEAIRPPVTVSHVSKKFCRDLRRSLWYGIQDLIPEILARTNDDRLRLRPAEFLALDDISFEVRPGECLGLLGANGAGKSTLLKVLNGLLRPDAGEVRIRGRLAALIELGAGFNPILTGRENIYVNGSVLGLAKSEIDSKFQMIVDFSELAASIDSPVQNYSSGMQARLGFAVAAHLDPDILLVDEVLAVGDIAFRMKCFDHFLGLKKMNKAIVLVSHNLVDITRVCDRVVVLDAGTMTYDGGVPGGIAAYEQQLLTRGGPERETVSDASAWIDSAEIINSNGRTENHFHTGEDVTVEVRLAARRRVPIARLIVHVSSPSVGILGSFSSPHAGVSFDIEPPGRNIRFTIETVPLLVGSYGLTLSLYGEKRTDFLDAITSAVHVTIIGPPTDTFGYGVCHSVSFNHRWDVGDLDSSPIMDAE